MAIDKIAFFGDSYCADLEGSYIEELSKDYEILHMGEHGFGLNFAVEQFRTFLLTNKNLDNIFFVFMNSASVRKQIQCTTNDPVTSSGERPLPFSSDPAICEDFNDSYLKAIKYHELYIQNDSEDLRNYHNSMEAQQWLIHKFKVNGYVRFLCFRHEAEILNNPLNFPYNNIKFTNLCDFSKHFTLEAPINPDFKNHFCSKGQKGMEQVIREAINECSN